MKCAPHRVGDPTLYNCFTRNELIRIIESYNSFTEICGENSNSCYKVKRINNIDNKSEEELYNSLAKRLSKLCKDENCWMNLQFIEEIPDSSFVENLKFFVFKPKMYGDRWKWLSTMDINYVLKQYEHFDSTFKFLGAQPCDFLELINKKDINNILNDKNIKKIGIVLNWDTHNNRGSHWVSIFIDKNEKIPTIEYFDSTGDSPNDNKWIKKTLNYLKNSKTLKNSNLLINKMEHQKGNTECGVYSIYFIIQRILGNDFKSITEKIVDDNDMNLFRDFIFQLDN